ncbi:MAG: hypothetical protein ACK421_02200 [Pseudanabaenaceae cyanobacterium]
MPKDSPHLLQEIQRLQKLAPKRLDKLEQQTELIMRSVAQTGLVTNSTIAHLEGKAPPPTAIRYSPRTVLVCLGVMVVTFFATDYILSQFIAHYFQRPDYRSWLEMLSAYCLGH